MNIGFFYDCPHKARNEADQIYHQMIKYDEHVVFKQKTMEIITGEGRYQFITLRPGTDDVCKISGMEFDAVFTKANFTSDIVQRIFIRFRPRCRCENK